MDDQRTGRSLRVLRHRRGLRQVDVAARSGTVQSLISEIESGRFEHVQYGVLRRVFAAVDARFSGMVQWRGAALDRLLDARHAGIVAVTADLVGGRGWDIHPEVSYSIFGERGSIDLLAARHDARIALVTEVKSELGSLEGAIRKLDEKARLGLDRIVMDKLGWRPLAVGRLLVLPRTEAARRAVRHNAAVLDAALPDRGATVRRWIHAPTGSLAGILFVPEPANIARADRGGGRPGACRVRPPGTTARRGARVR